MSVEIHQSLLHTLNRKNYQADAERDFEVGCFWQHRIFVV